MAGDVLVEPVELAMLVPGIELERGPLVIKAAPAVVNVSAPVVVEAVLARRAVDGTATVLLAKATLIVVGRILAMLVPRVVLVVGASVVITVTTPGLADTAVAVTVDGAVFIRVDGKSMEPVVEATMAMVGT